MADKPKKQKGYTSGFCASGNHQFCKVWELETPSCVLSCDCDHHYVRKVVKQPAPKAKVRRVVRR